MNWFNLLKFAFPFQEEHKVEHYWDVLHPSQPSKQAKIILWFIDKNMNLHTTDKADRHSNWWDYIDYADNMLSAGRYSPRDKTCTVVISLFGISPSDEYKIKKIEQILDKTFNNPKILQF